MRYTTGRGRRADRFATLDIWHGPEQCTKDGAVEHQTSYDHHSTTPPIFNNEVISEGRKHEGAESRATNGNSSS